MQNLFLELEVKLEERFKIVSLRHDHSQENKLLSKLMHGKARGPKYTVVFFVFFSWLSKKKKKN